MTQNNNRPKKSGMKPRNRIPQMSKARHARMREYKKVRCEFLSENKKCKRCGKPATDIHHLRGRVGKLLVMKEYFVALDRQCHNWVGENPVEARAAGLLCEYGKWGMVKP